MKRTEAEALSRTPLKLKLGDQEYQAPILKIGAAREWREKLTAELAELFEPMASETVKNLPAAMTAQFLKYPDKILELIKSYVPGLPWKTIETDVTEEQVQIAYGQIVEVAFPYLAHLIATRQALAK